MKNFLAMLGALLTFYALVPYMIDTVKGKTKPNIVTWFTWTLLTSVATAAAFAAHEPRTAVLTMANAIGTGMIVVLGIKYGVAKFSWFDGLCQFGVLVGLVLWLIFNSPAIAIVAAVIIDFVGLLPTLRHSWLKPHEETLQTFFLSTIAPLFTIAALSHYSIESLLFPIYLLIADGAVTVILLYRKGQLFKGATY